MRTEVRAMNQALRSLIEEDDRIAEYASAFRFLSGSNPRLDTVIAKAFPIIEAIGWDVLVLRLGPDGASASLRHEDGVKMVTVMRETLSEALVAAITKAAMRTW